MKIGVPKETGEGENRVAATPDSIKKFASKNKGIQFLIESGAGDRAHYSDASYTEVGAEIVDRKTALGADIVLKINRLDPEDVHGLSKGGLVLSLIDPFADDDYLDNIAKTGAATIGLELIPRISRAQSMDVLSSQANIAGYRAVVEACNQFGRFFPMMMTSAGSARPAKVIILGVGVAGLQAIATAKRLGANVEAFDVRPEVKEQVESLGAKFIEIDLGESGAGEGGYAKELSEEAKAKQEAGLAEKMKKADIIITTALIPGRPAPLLVKANVVEEMRQGSVIVDLAAPNGGNCELTEKGQIVNKNGVILVGVTNFVSLMPSDSSDFFARNLTNLLALIIKPGEGEGAAPTMTLDMEDEIIEAALAVNNGEVRFQKK